MQRKRRRNPCKMAKLRCPRPRWPPARHRWPSNRRSKWWRWIRSAVCVRWKWRAVRSQAWRRVRCWSESKPREFNNAEKLILKCNEALGGGWWSDALLPYGRCMFLAVSRPLCRQDVAWTWVPWGLRGKSGMILRANPAKQLLHSSFLCDPVDQ